MRPGSLIQLYIGSPQTRLDAHEVSSKLVVAFLVYNDLVLALTRFLGLALFSGSDTEWASMNLNSRSRRRSASVHLRRLIHQLNRERTLSGLGRTNGLSDESSVTGPEFRSDFALGSSMQTSLDDKYFGATVHSRDGVWRRARRHGRSTKPPRAPH